MIRLEKRIKALSPSLHKRIYGDKKKKEEEEKKKKEEEEQDLDMGDLFGY